MYCPMLKIVKVLVIIQFTNPNIEKTYDIKSETMTNMETSYFWN